MEMRKYEFFENGSYCYHVMGGVILFHATVRTLIGGELVEKSTLDMVDTEMTVSEFETMDLIRHIDGKIPVDFFPASVWEDHPEELAEEDVAPNMVPIFAIEEGDDVLDLAWSVEGTYDQLLDTLLRMRRQWRLGLRETCPQMVLVDVKEWGWA